MHGSDNKLQNKKLDGWHFLGLSVLLYFIPMIPFQGKHYHREQFFPWERRRRLVNPDLRSWQNPSVSQRPGEYAYNTCVCICVFGSWQNPSVSQDQESTHTTLVFVFVYLEVEKSLCLPSQQKKVCLQHFRSFFGQIQIITHFSLTFIILVVCKNESFCHRNHFRELYVASIRR